MTIDSDARPSMEALGIQPEAAETSPITPEGLIAAIGNSEAKATALLVLQPTPQSDYNLRSAFNDATLDVWRSIDHSTISGWMRKSIIPAGLATETPEGYSSTPQGEAIGKPVAKLLLAATSASPLSLGELFGRSSAGAGESKPVLNRIKVLEELQQRETHLTPAELEKITEIPFSVVKRHLEDLERIGLISMSPVSRRSSAAQITDSGVNLVNNLISPVKIAVAGDRPDLLRKWDAIDWKSYAPSGVEKHREKSGNAHQQPIDTTLVEFGRIIEQNPGITTAQLRAKTGRKDSRSVTSMLVRRGEVTKSGTGKNTIYTSS